MTAVDVDTTAQDAAWWAMDVPCESTRGRFDAPATCQVLPSCGCSANLCAAHTEGSRKNVAELILCGLAGMCSKCQMRSDPRRVVWRPL